MASQLTRSPSSTIDDSDAMSTTSSSSSANPKDDEVWDSATSVLVTGGAGFVGSHVAEALLARGAAGPTAVAAAEAVRRALELPTHGNRTGAAQVLRHKLAGWPAFAIIDTHRRAQRLNYGQFCHAFW